MSIVKKKVKEAELRETLYKIIARITELSYFRVAQIVASWQRRCEKVEEERENGRKWEEMREREMPQHCFVLYCFVAKC